MLKRVAAALAVLLICPLTSSAVSNDDFFQFKRAQRRIKCAGAKNSVTEYNQRLNWPDQTNNGDENLYPDLRGSFGKTLSHFGSGYIRPEAFNSLVKAIQSGNPSDFDTIEMGEGIVKLVSPQASAAFSLSCNDSWCNDIPPAPAFASAQTAAEMVEVYWAALCRDIPFNEFSASAAVASAITDLNTMSDFRGPKFGGAVTPATFLRGSTPGDLAGPYISQFLYQTIPFGSTSIPPEQTVPLPGAGNDFNTSSSDWFTVVNGGQTGSAISFDNSPRFIRTPRDLAEYVHVDTPGQAALGAALILASYGPSALDPANPYLNNPTQSGFVTFGISQVLELIREATHEALKAAWYHKWEVNRRLRPEEYGFYVQEQIVKGTPLGISPELINSTALANIFAAFGTYFVPTAYPEGCPAHPAYPAGHAAFIGAGVTILKAYFNENFQIPDPLEPDAANTNLVAYPGPLTVGGELNKLAANISLGRDLAGVHYRSDGYYGMLLGEKVAIDVLNNQSFLFKENFEGYTLTKFDGTTITVGQKRTP